MIDMNDLWIQMNFPEWFPDIYESKAISFRPIDQIARFMRNGFVQIYRWYKSGQFWTDKDHGMFVLNR